MLWLLNNWKTVAFALVVAALVATGWKLYRAGAEQATLEHSLEIQRQVNASLMVQAALNNAALESHTKRTQEDAAKIKELNDRISTLNEYADTPQVSGGSCFDGTDTGRVRDLWNSGSGSAGPASAPR